MQCLFFYKFGGAFCFVLFEMGFYSVTHAGLQLGVILLCQPPKCQDYRHAPLHLARKSLVPYAVNKMSSKSLQSYTGWKTPAAGPRPLQTVAVWGDLFHPSAYLWSLLTCFRHSVLNLWVKSFRLWRNCHIAYGKMASKVMAFKKQNNRNDPAM